MPRHPITAIRKLSISPLNKTFSIAISAALLASVLLSAVRLGWLCPHPEHWLDTILEATRLKTHPPGPPDFVSPDPSETIEQRVRPGNPSTLIPVTME